VWAQDDAIKTGVLRQAGVDPDEEIQEYGEYEEETEDGEEEEEEEDFKFDEATGEELVPEVNKVETVLAKKAGVHPGGAVLFKEDSDDEETYEENEEEAEEEVRVFEFGCAGERVRVCGTLSLGVLVCGSGCVDF
jgi:hypothetical protein